MNKRFLTYIKLGLILSSVAFIIFIFYPKTTEAVTCQITGFTTNGVSVATITSVPANVTVNWSAPGCEWGRVWIAPGSPFSTTFGANTHSVNTSEIYSMIAGMYTCDSTGSTLDQSCGVPSYEYTSVSASTRVEYVPPPQPASITVYPGTCPSTATWNSNISASNVVGGGPSTFSYTAPSGGANVGLWIQTVPSGWVPDVTYPPSSGYQVISDQGGSYSYTLNCHQPVPPVLVATTTANTSSLSCGQTATISWGSTGATSCTSSWGAGIGTNGSQSNLGPGSYTITCTDGTSSVTSNTTVVSQSGSCGSPPVVSLTATPSSVAPNGYTTLKWTSSGANSCTGTWWDGGSTATENLGGIAVPISVSTNFTKTCTNNDGSGSDSKTVTVTSGPDLTATAPTPAAATVNVSQTFTSSINNIGGASTGAGFSNFFQVATAAAGGGTLTDISPAVPLAALAAGGSNQVTSSYPFPSTGTYSVRACADKTNSGSSGVITETDETNNCSGWTNVVVSSGAFTYTLAPSPAGNLSIAQGAQDQKMIVKTLTSGTGQAVNLTANGVPSGVAIVYPNQGCTPTPTCNGWVNFAVPVGFSPGIYPISVVGSPGGVIAPSFNLVVTTSSAFPVTCTPSDPNPLLGTPVTWTVTVGSGGVAPFSYVYSGDGFTSPTTPTANNTKVVTYSTTGQKSFTAAVTDSNNNVGVCTPPGTLTVKFNPRIQPF